MTQKQKQERSSWSYRPHFSPRQLLTADQLNAGFNDELLRQRLLSRAVHGYGVVTGFGPAHDDRGRLDLKRGCFDLSGGLALDRLGRMLFWPGGPIGMADIVGPKPDCADHYTLCAHYAIQRPPAPGCLPLGGHEAKWWRQSVVFTLRRHCYEVDRSCPDHPDGACPSHDHYLCRRTGAIPGERPSDVPVSDDVGWVLAEPGDLCPTDDGHWEYDPDPEVCVPLGCFEICDLANDDHGHDDDDEHASDEVDDDDAEADERKHRPRCEPRYGFCPIAPDPCRSRPLVYRNPLLYELANCCDVELARVERVSWQDWLDAGWSTPVPWPEFAQRITGAGRGFEIWFSHPIKAETINDASVFLTAVVTERRSDYLVTERVPMRELTLLERQGDLARGVRLMPTYDWIRAEVTGNQGTLDLGSCFELTIRGQLLRDRCDQTLDARPLDIATDARCQARPGGDFISAFQVEPRRRRPHHGGDEGNESVETS